MNAASGVSQPSFRVITTILATLVLLGTCPLPAAAQWLPTRPDSHAPIGVMGDHLHAPGEVTLSYRFIAVRMEGSRDGGERLEDSFIVSPDGYGFQLTPVRLDVQVHMLGVAWAPVEGVTLVGTVPFERRSMDHVTRAGDTFSTESNGPGDIAVGGLLRLARGRRQVAHLGLLVTLPIGAIDERGESPLSSGPVQLPYVMQIGSGTMELRPAFAWLGQTDTYSWGVEGNGLIRLSTNDRGWAPGDLLAGTVWFARTFGMSASASLRVEGTTRSDVRGLDLALDPVASPANGPRLTGGARIDVGAGINVQVPRLSAFRVAVEAMAPIYQNLRGPQLETDWRFVAGLQVVPIR